MDRLAPKRGKHGGMIPPKIERASRSRPAKSAAFDHARYAHYHTREDTPERLDYEGMARVVAGLERMLIELAGGSRR